MRSLKSVEKPISPILFCLLGCIVFCSCGSKRETPAESSQELSGEQLSKFYCGSCHAYPEPGLLDKQTWRKQTLPMMAARFGIYEDWPRDSLLEKGTARHIVERAGVFPRNKTISDEDWTKIVAYYVDNAPESLAIPGAPDVAETSLFKASFPSFKIERAAVSAITYDPAEQLIYLADCSLENQSSIFILDSRLRAVAQLGLTQPVSRLIKRPEGLYILQLGHMVPSDEPAGSLLKAIKDKSGENYKGYSIVLNHLKRPVDLTFVDVESDGDDDMVVCEYGNHTGQLSLFTNNGKNRYVHKTLLTAPGAIRVLAGDLNNDSLPDLAVLMAQGDEGIDLYYNLGSGNFRRSRVLQFSPVYGSVDITLADFNQDGYQDILYLNGDNADYSSILKPYHGIRIFLNNGRNEFSEAYFFSFHGAYKGIALDFDQDGDIDIGAISFFPDFQNNLQRGFIFLENVASEETLHFKTSTFAGSGDGRWISMSSGDFDQDQDEDLLLGNFTAMGILNDPDEVLQQRLIRKQVTVALLKNNLKQ